jgi:mannose-6-phosphate isomerase
MQTAYRLDNPIMTYAWGSYTALSDLLGQPRPSETPQAELWMGTHPKAPSMLAGAKPPRSLADLIKADTVHCLGPSTAAAFGGQLPFLFKVLAAREPLSIQAHPSLEQAREGFARENKAGIPLDASQRNYRDANHKPELICALTPFWALCGFRPPEQIARLLEKACGESLKHLIQGLTSESPSSSLGTFFQRLLDLSAAERGAALEEAMGFCLASREDAAHWRWIPRLAQSYPGDIGALAPLFLNLVCLQPGEALFLPAGVLHAYLEGTGIEIMANSDNVLRGGLTPKHVDLPELLRVLDFDRFDLNVLSARPLREGVTAFDALCPEFRLYQLFPGQAETSLELKTTGPEMLLCTAGDTILHAGEPATDLKVSKGDVLFIPADTGNYTLSGEGCLYRATVPTER